VLANTTTQSGARPQSWARVALGRLTQVLLLFPALAFAAEPVATVTFLEGGASLLRGVARYALAEGVRLENADIVELNDKALAQIEFTDGTLVALGPRSRLMVLSYPSGAARARGAGELFLLTGWLKVERPRAEPHVISRIRTPALELSLANTTAVIDATAAEAMVFLESGEARAAQAGKGGQAEEPVRLKGSQFYACKRDQRCVVAPRPTRAFLEGIPRSFMDTLPSRLPKFKEHAVAPRRSGDFTYEEVEAWVNSPTPPVRRVVVNRWHAKASDPAFRDALATNMREHPEWDRILNPEKYKESQEPWTSERRTGPR